MHTKEKLPETVQIRGIKKIGCFALVLLQMLQNNVFFSQTNDEIIIISFDPILASWLSKKIKTVQLQQKHCSCARISNSHLE